MSSFTFTRGINNKVLKKNVNFATNPKINNNIFTLNNSNSNLNLSVLTLNGSTVTSDGNQLNYIDNVTNGVGIANKVLIPDNNLDITNINTLSCDSLIVNGNTLSISNSNTASDSNSPYLQKIKSGKIQNNKAIVPDNNRDIETLNKLGVGTLNINDKKIINSSDQIIKKKIHPITWSINSTTYANNLTSICWSYELGLGVVVSSTGTGNRVMTSPDGITWTNRNTPADNNWTSVCWSPQLSQYIAVSSSGSGDMRMISSDGINWTQPNPTIFPISISSAMDHTIILNNNGTVSYIGNNSYRQFGDGTTNTISTLRLIPNLTNVSSIAAGRELNLLIMNDGSIRTIGRNDYGQLGIGNNTPSTVINTVPGITNAIAGISGDYHCLVLLSDGTIQSWGNNSNGQLGNGNTSTSFSPVQVSGISTATAISMQYRSVLALLSDGTIKAWGDNSYGQLGDNSNTQRSTPVSVSGISNAIAIACGYYHSLALLSDGTIKAWGYNAYGQLGNNSTTNSLIPINVSNITNAIAISAGTFHSIALLADGTIRTWGRNLYGQLGDGTNGAGTDKLIPTVISSLNNVSNVIANWDQTFVILNDKTIKSWGYNNARQLADGSAINKNSPSNVWSIKSIDSTWSSICWSQELSLYVAVASSGSTRVMTSSDGINWIGRNAARDNSWTSVIWVKELNLFVAVSSSGSNDRVMTSSDGINWTARTSAADNNWNSVCWTSGMNMLVAVASSGSNNRIMTSPDGITWTTRNSPTNNNWISVCYASELNLIVAISSSGSNRIMYSDNGTEWFNTLYSNIDANLDNIIWISSLQKFIIISGNTLLYSDYVNQNTDLMTNNNWYSLFNKINTGWTIAQTGTNPDVELQINSSSAYGAEPKLWYQNRIQDYSTFTINFEIKMSGSADATSFNIGHSSSSFYADGPNNPAFCLAFRIFSGAGTYFFLGNTQIQFSSTNINDNTWKTIQIIYNKSTTNTWTIKLNGSNIFTYNDTSHATWLASTGDYFGFGSRTGGLSHNSFIRRFNITGTNSIPQTTTIVNSSIINTKIFNENFNLYNQGKIYNALSNTIQLTPNKIIGFSYNFYPYSSIWVKELGIYIIGGSGGNLAISSNGYDWTAYISGISTSIEDICWSPELQLLVAVSNATTNNIITSVDGKNWTIQTNVPSEFGNSWSGICWVSELSLFVAVGSATHATNRVMTSPNGIIWTIRTGLNNNWQSVCWSPELAMLVAVGQSNNNVMYSYDGINWNTHNSKNGSASSETFKKICWSSELFMFVAISNDRIKISKDGMNWYYRTISSQNWEWVIWIKSLSVFIAVGGSDNIIYSVDGINWKNTYGVLFGSYTIAYSDELNNFIACDYNKIINFNNLEYNQYSLRSNTNLNYLSNYNNYYENQLYNTWYSNHSNINNEWTSVCYSTDLSLLVAISKTGTGNRVMTSEDGITWTSRVSSSDNDWTSICWSSELDLFAAVANSGTGDRVMTSPDGINWTSRASASDNDWTSICWSTELNLFVAVASSGTGDRVMTSSDGINWTSRTSASDNNWTSICWSPELSIFVVVASSGNGNRIMTSPNGISWTSRTSPANNNWTSVCWSYYYNLFIAVASSGSDNRIMKSSDGINWNTSVLYKPSSSITNSMKSIYAGEQSAIAIHEDTRFKAWGLNGSSQFTGAGTMVLPNDQNDFHSSNGSWNNIKSIVLTNNTSIALLNNGRVQTKGSGILGINTPNWGNSIFGVNNIPNLTNVIEIAAGANHALALLSDGTIKSWCNSNSFGQLGNGTTTISLTPINVSTINNAISVSAKVLGYHSLALLSDGTVMAWGYNANGQLGNNTTTNSLSPILIDNLSNVIAISAGSNHSLALLSDGTVMAWGNNSNGQLGNNTTNQSLIPIQVVGLTNVLAISAGRDHSLALLSNGTVMAWGGNLYGQLGDGTNIDKLSPILISNLNNINAISAGNYFSLVLLNDSTMKSWGRNNSGQLGNNSQIDSNIPVNVQFNTNSTNLLRGIKIERINNLNYINNNWTSISWSPEMKIFVAISSSGTNRCIISNDGNTWYSKELLIQNNWTSICWADLLSKFIGISTNNTNNIISSNIGNPSLLSTITSIGTRQLNFNSNDNLLIGGNLNISWTKITINADNSNNLLRLTNNSSNINCVDFNANGSSISQINIVNNSNNKITNIVNHNGTTFGLLLNNTLIPVNSNDLNKLDVTQGIASPSKALVLNSTRDINNINNISVNKLIVNNKVILNTNDNNNVYLTNITPGIAVESKALVLDSDKNITELNKISSNNILLKNINTIKSHINKSTFNLQSYYFSNFRNEFKYPSNLNAKTIAWSPELGIFIAIGNSWYDAGGNKTSSNYNINYSTDGINWIAIPTLVYNSSIIPSSVAWSSSLRLFVVVFNNNYRVAYSSDGKAWIFIELNSSTFSFGYTSIVWASTLNMFVAVSSTGTAAQRIMTSTDGKTWTARTSPNTNNWTSITFGNNTLVAVSNSGTGNRVMTSTDGINWTSRSTPADNNWVSITWGNNLFVAIANSGINNRIMTSPDGINWTIRTSPADLNWRSIIWAKDKFIACNDSGGSNNRIMTSSDGTNWIIQNTTNVNINYSCLVYSPELDLLVAGSDGNGQNNQYYYHKIATSTNGTTWTLRDTNYDLVWHDLIYVNELGLYIAVSNANTQPNVSPFYKQLATSTNGIDWTFRMIDSNMLAAFRQLVWSPELNLLIVVYCVANSTVIYKSTNGINWTPVTVPPGLWITVKWISNWNMFIAVAPSGTNRVIQSTDGNIWTVVNMPSIQQIYNIDYSPSLNIGIITTLSNPTIYFTSTNGNTWIQRTMMNGVSNINTWSESNITWISQLGIFLYTWNGTSEYYTSTDGLIWTRRNFQITINSTRYFNLKIITSKPIWINKLNKLYIISTLDNYSAIFESSDGLTWTGVYSINAPHAFYSNLYWNNNTETLISYGYDSYKTPVSPFLVLNQFKDPINNYNISAINNLNKIDYDASLESINNWISRSSVNDNNWMSLCYSLDKNLFVAISNSGTGNRVMTSPDAITWTSRTSSADSNWSSIAYSENLSLFVAVANGGTNRLMTSSDAITWTNRDVIANDWQSICWSPELDLFVAISSTGLTYNSIPNNMTGNNSMNKIASASSRLSQDYPTDASTWDPWNAFDGTINTGWHSRGSGSNTYNNNTGVYTGNVSTIDSSSTTHSGEWLQIQLETAIVLGSFIITGRSGYETERLPRTFVILGSNNGSTWDLVYTETDKTNWSTSPVRFNVTNNNNTSYSYYRIVCKRLGNSNSGMGGASSVQIMNWELLEFLTSNGNNKVLLSPNGINWENRNASNNNNWTSICWSSELDLFVAVANSGTGNRVMTSPDGINWTSRTSASDNNWTSICWSPELSLFVAVANSGTSDRIMTSPDAITWTTRSNPVDNDWTSICWASEIGTFIAVSNTGTGDRIMTSFNGITWTSRNNIIDNNWTSICWSSGYNKAVVVSNSGTGNRVLTSTISLPYPKSNYYTAPNSFNINQVNGRVGLGTITPNYQLELNSDSAAKPSTAFWSVSSDKRLKENIEDADLDLCYENIKKLRLVKYTWKDELYYNPLDYPETNPETSSETNPETSSETNPETSSEMNKFPIIPSEESRTQLGWIANEVEEIFPKAVTEVKAYNYNDCKSLDSDQIISSLFGTAKKLLIEYENQNNKINNLKNEISNLENFINQLDISLE